MTAACAGCANGFAGREPIARKLPDAPSFAVPVAVAEPRKGEYELAVAARERAARKQNASRLDRFRMWYDGVKKNYAAPR